MSRARLGNDTMTEEEKGALVIKGCYGMLGRLRPLLTGLIVILVVQGAMMTLRVIGYFPLSPVVLLFTIIAMTFESMILTMAFLKVKNSYGAGPGMIWTGELDWDIYENGILTKTSSSDRPGTVETRFVPFRKMARVIFFPQGQMRLGVFGLYQDTLRYRDDERPAGAGTLTPETAAVISTRIWFVGVDGKLLDLTMAQNQITARNANRFRELLRNKVKVVE